MESNKKFADIVMIPMHYRHKDILYTYIIEFKYIKSKIKGETLKTTIKEKIEEATKQLNDYASDENVLKELGVKPFGDITLKKIIVVFHGWKMVYCEENLEFGIRNSENS
jgi:ribosomal protein L10